ncbi:hypothetical protein HDU67_000916 [Dinochytrium kinnereticum]|nr:hypothetical protein HDU67_000916 [Dinochytrium kinnereticum]
MERRLPAHPSSSLSAGTIAFPPYETFDAPHGKTVKEVPYIDEEESEPYIVVAPAQEAKRSACCMNSSQQKIRIVGTVFIVVIVLAAGIAGTYFAIRRLDQAKNITLGQPGSGGSPTNGDGVEVSKTIGVADDAPLIESQIVFPEIMSRSKSGVERKSVFGSRIAYSEENLGMYVVPKLADGSNATTGVTAIHAGVMVGTGKVVFVERWDIHGTPLKAGNPPLPVWSSEYDTTTNTVRPLNLVSNVFCGAGALLPDGRVIVMGGAEPHPPTVGPNGPVRGIEAGERVIRFIKPSIEEGGGFGEEDWLDRPSDRNLLLVEKRWYPTVLSLPNGKIIAIGGSDRGVAFNSRVENIPSLEVFPRSSSGNATIDLPFLRDTLPTNLYGISSVLPSGRIYFFASNKSTVLDPSVGANSTARQCLNATRMENMGLNDILGADWTMRMDRCISNTENPTRMVPCDQSDQAQLFELRRLSRVGTVQVASINDSVGCITYTDSTVRLSPCQANATRQAFTINIVSPSSSVYRYFEYPELPPGPFRSYPLTGFGAMLPLDPSISYDPSFIVCGGADNISPQTTFPIDPIKELANAVALDSCGLIRPEHLSEGWTGETDPMPTGGRVMADFVLLPDGTGLVINGAGAGMAGWDKGRRPQTTALLYLPNNSEGDRWRVLNSTTFARLYHSVAFLLPDARVMIGGSAPNAAGETLTYASYQNELTAEYYLPPYLTHPDAAPDRRPVLVGGRDFIARSPPKSPRGSSNYFTTEPSDLAGWHDPWVYNTSRLFKLRIPKDKLAAALDPSRIQFSLLQSGFRTHSTGMSERHVWLRSVVMAEPVSVLTEVPNPAPAQSDNQKLPKFIEIKVAVECPPLPTIAPPGWYMLFAVVDGIPAVARWVQVGGDPARLSRFN